MTITGPAPTIDLLSASAFRGGQPHDQFRWLRENDPVHWHEEPDGRGFWALTRHRDVKAVGRAPELFSSEPSILIPDATAMMSDHQMFLMLDAPRHTAQRKLISSRFIPRAARALQPRIRELATMMVDGVIERGECDLVEDVAGLMPSYVLAELLGIPLEDGVALYPLTEAIHSTPDSQPAGAAIGAVMSMFSYAHEVWDRKRAEPGDDLASLIAHGKIADVPVDEVDFNLYFLLLVDAGGDTTRNLVGAGLHALMEHPDQLRRLREDTDGVMATAVEEMLRWVSPVVYMRRTAKVGTRIGTQDIAAGDKVVMYYGAANRDPSVFAAAERFDIGRRPNDHVAFGGGGPHFCLGAHVARLEIEEILREVVTRMVDLEPAGEPEWLASNFISGLKHLPVRFRPGPRRGPTPV